MSSDKYGRANEPHAATKKPPRHTPRTRAHVFNYRKPRLEQEITHSPTLVTLRLLHSGAMLPPYGRRYGRYSHADREGRGTATATTAP
jgi:hypothetical protein